MNCDRTRELLLLSSSGEAPADSRVHIDRHLASCPECRAFDAETRWILTAAGSAPLEADISELTLARIAEAARGASIRPATVQPTFWQAWRPALTYGAAAVVVVALGIGVLRHAAPHPDASSAASSSADSTPTLAWDPSLDQELNTLDAVLTMAFEDVEEPQPESAEDIAFDLARMEGWGI